MGTITYTEVTLARKYYGGQHTNTLRDSRETIEVIVATVATITPIHILRELDIATYHEWPLT